MTLAHAGHWLLNLIYALPLIMVIVLIVRDRLKHRGDGDQEPQD